MPPGALSTSCAPTGSPGSVTRTCCLTFLLIVHRLLPWDDITSDPFLPDSRPCPVPFSVLLLPFAFCRDFDSLSKDNVFENNRLVSPHADGSPRGGRWGGHWSCRAGAVARGSWTSSLRSGLALGPWLLLSPASWFPLAHLCLEHQTSSSSRSSCGVRAEGSPESTLPWSPSSH